MKGKLVKMSDEDSLSELHEKIVELTGRVERQEELIKQLLNLLYDKKTLTDDDEYPELLIVAEAGRHSRHG